MKNIVIINNNNYGSTGNIMLNIAKTARLSNYNVYTCCKNSKAAKKINNENHIFIGYWLERVISEQLAYYTGLKNHFNVLGTYAFINKLNKIKPDLINIHNLHDTYLNLPIFINYIKKNNIPLVYTMHDCWLLTGQCSWFDIANCDKWQSQCNNCPQLNRYPDTKIDKANKLFLEKKDLFSSLNNVTLVSPSNWLANLVKQSYLKDKDIKVINNGINLDIFKPTDSDFREKYNIGNKHILLCVATSYDQRKGLDVFIELSKRLPDNYQIVLVGTNDNIDSKLPSNIISIHKTYNQNELAQIYTAADLFVNPTREDNFPTVNLEALACGTPVLTYDTGGSKESLNDKCGAYVVKNDFEALLNKITDICENNTYKKENCLQQAKQFNMFDKFKEYVKLFDSILR